jgi:hypothetical protein
MLREHRFNRANYHDHMYCISAVLVVEDARATEIHATRLRRITFSSVCNTNHTSESMPMFSFQLRNIKEDAVVLSSSLYQISPPATSIGLSQAIYQRLIGALSRLCAHESALY